MSKQLFVSLRGEEFIIKGTFVGTERDEKGFIIFQDRDKLTTKGYDRVDGVYFMVAEANEYATTVYHKAWISKEDIVNLAERIKQIESVEKIDKIEDELPF